MCIGEAHPQGHGQHPGEHTTKEIDSHSSLPSIVNGSLSRDRHSCDSPASCWDVDWLDIVQVLFRQPDALCVSYMSNLSNKYHKLSLLFLLNR